VSEFLDTLGLVKSYFPSFFELEFEDLQYLYFKVDTVWNAVRDKEMEHNLTREELKRIREGQTREMIAKERF
jgi:hypothetical protein